MTRGSAGLSRRLGALTRRAVKAAVHREETIQPRPHPVPVPTELTRLPSGGQRREVEVHDALAQRVGGQSVGGQGDGGRPRGSVVRRRRRRRSRARHRAGEQGQQAQGQGAGHRCALPGGHDVWRCCQRQHEDEKEPPSREGWSAASKGSGTQPCLPPALLWPSCGRYQPQRRLSSSASRPASPSCASSWCVPPCLERIPAAATGV